MTRFTGPLKVKMPFSETTVARVDTSGSAQFAQGADFGGAVIVDGTLDVSGAVTFAAGISANATASSSTSSSLSIVPFRVLMLLSLKRIRPKTVCSSSGRSHPSRAETAKS